MIQKFQIYNESIFKPKKLKSRTSAAKQMKQKKLLEMRELIQKHQNAIDKKIKKFKYSSIDSEDLEQIVEFFFTEEGMFEYFEFSGYAHDDEELDKFLNLYVASIVLKDKIKKGRFFDWKQQRSLKNYLDKNIKDPWKFAYNAYPGGDGVSVVFSKIELKNCEDALDNNYDEEDDY